MSRKMQWNLYGALALIFSLILIGICMETAIGSSVLNLGHYTIIAMTSDVIGMFGCSILFSSLFYDRRITRNSALFMLMLMLVCMLLYCEYFAFLYNGRSDYYIVLEITYYYIYCLLLIILLTHWIYLKQQLQKENRNYNRAEIAYYLCFFVGMVLLLVNRFNGCLFSIDRISGYIVIGEYRFLFTIPPMLMLTINAFCAHYFYSDKKRKYILYAYSIMFFFAMILRTVIPHPWSLGIFFLFATFLIHGGFYVERGQEITRKNAEIVEQNVTMMISQIQPYFLYNSLNSISRIEGNPLETKKAVEDFAKYLRSNLNTISQTTTIPISKEIEHVKTYVELEKLRFKEKLNVVYTITDTDFKIPPLTLQMLVENAIKHGITQKEGGGTVTIVTMEDHNSHRITVTDDGVGFDTEIPPSDESRSHVGIVNITERLRDLLDARLEISSEIGRGTVAVVSIPKNTINDD